MDTETFIKLVQKLANVGNIYIDADDSPSNYTRERNNAVADAFKSAVTTFNLLKASNEEN